MYCENCGSQMPDGSKFCISCGAKVENREDLQEGSVQETAASMDNAAASVLEDPVPQPILPQPVPTPPAASQPVQTAQTVQTQQTPPAYSQTATNQNYQQPVQPVSSQQQAAPQQVIFRKPAATTPLPVWKFIGIFLLMGIPILNIVMIFVWSFGHSCNQNTKNYARAILILWVIAIVFVIVGYFTIWSSISALLGDYSMPYFTY